MRKYNLNWHAYSVCVAGIDLSQIWQQVAHNLVPIFLYTDSVADLIWICTTSYCTIYATIYGTIEFIIRHYVIHNNWGAARGGPIVMEAAGGRLHSVGWWDLRCHIWYPISYLNGFQMAGFRLRHVAETTHCSNHPCGKPRPNKLETVVKHVVFVCNQMHLDSLYPMCKPNSRGQRCTFTRKSLTLPRAKFPFSSGTWCEFGAAPPHLRCSSLVVCWSQWLSVPSTCNSLNEPTKICGSISHAVNMWI